MNKETLIAKVAEATGTTKKDAKVQVDAVLDAIVNGLQEDGEVSFVGFGTFKAVHVEERTHRNPKDGSEVVKPAHKKVKFKAGKALKELVNS